jgi:hypothetical protein
MHELPFARFVNLTQGQQAGVHMLVGYSHVASFGGLAFKAAAMARSEFIVVTPFEVVVERAVERILCSFASRTFEQHP